MIKQFQKIKNVGCYDDFIFEPSQLNPFDRINILYGNNGSGKTTFSNLLFLLSKHCKDKSQLISELLDEGSELEIVTDSGKVTHKTIGDKNIDIYVFNTKFINDHVYNGTTANIESFSSEIKLTSPEIQSIDLELKKNNDRQIKINKWISSAQERIDNIYKHYSEDFQNRVSNARLTNVKPIISKKGIGDFVVLKVELEGLYKEYLKKHKESSIIEKIEGLKIKISEILNININIDDLTLKLKSQVASDTKNLIASKINFFQEKIAEKNYTKPIGDLTDWMKTGGRLLYLTKGEQENCPLCNTDLTTTINDLLNEFTRHFSNNILHLHNALDSSINILEKFTNSNLINLNKHLIDEIITNCNENYNIQIAPINDQGVKTEILTKDIQSLVSLLKLKKKEPESELEIEDEVSKKLASYINSINEFKVRVKAYPI